MSEEHESAKFHSPEALREYLREHPDSDRSKHKVMTPAERTREYEQRKQAERVAARYLQTTEGSFSRSNPMAEEHKAKKSPASPEAVENAAIAAKNVGELLKRMIEEAGTGEDAKRMAPVPTQLARILETYKSQIEVMAKGVAAIPKGKEQDRAKAIIKQLAAIFDKGFETSPGHPYKWQGAQWLSPADTNKVLGKLMPLVHELDKLLTGQKVLFAHCYDRR